MWVGFCLRSAPAHWTAFYDIDCSKTEELRVSSLRIYDFVKSRITNVSEFTNSRTDISFFTNSRTIFPFFTNHEQDRFHEFTNDFFHFHEFTNEKKPIPACTNAAGGASSLGKWWQLSVFNGFDTTNSL